MLKRSLLAIVLLAGTAFPATAQDMATRILTMEEQIRALTGQIEELNHAVQQMQQQLGAPQQTGTLEQAPKQIQEPQKKLTLKKLAEAPAPGEGMEQIGEPVAPKKVEPVILGGESLTTLNDDATQGITTQDGEPAIGEQSAQAVVPGTQGQVIDGTQQGQVADGTQQGQVIDGTQEGESIETVSLTPQTESPETMYERYYEAQLRKRYDEAETGFNDFMQKYPDNSLAGTVQYRLGEVFYAKSDFRAAASNFLKGYTQYPKSRRAPDSLLMLGMSLRKLGEKEKACDALASVGTEFPRAIEAKKKAQAEYKRAGC
jgi:tol-pal system protein YbgF